MPTPNPSSSALQRFLARQIELKSDKLQKSLAKAQSQNDMAQAAELQAQIDDICQKFERSNWLHSAQKMAKQLKFGTHISKGVHPDAKGDNAIFHSSKHTSWVGTHTLTRPALDANGNAAALPLASFFDFDVTDGVKVRDLILKDDADFIASLSDDAQLAAVYHADFKQLLQGKISQPATDERNKQLLWATNDVVDTPLDELQYTTIIPLYPSALTHEVFLKINHLRYSDENKQALQNRFKANKEQQAYVSLPDLAVVQLGGSKPQNVSQLTSRQGGRSYLLPSTPPKLSRQHTFALSKATSSIFQSKSMAYQTKDSIEQIVAVLKDVRNTIDVRNRRKEAIAKLLHTIFAAAQQLQAQQAGWSRGYALDLSQKMWLDPKRGELAGEEDFALAKMQRDWQRDIIEQFASWLNHTLQKQLKNLRFAIGDAEHLQWQREIEAMKAEYERAGQGLFI